MDQYTLGGVIGILENLPYLLAFLDGGKLQQQEEADKGGARAPMTGDARIRLATVLCDFTLSVETLNDTQFRFLVAVYCAGFSNFALAQHYHCGEPSICNRKKALAGRLMRRMNRNIPRCLSCRHAASASDGVGYYCWAQQYWLLAKDAETYSDCKDFAFKEELEQRRHETIHRILARMEVDRRPEDEVAEVLERMMGVCSY